MERRLRWMGEVWWGVSCSNGVQVQGILEREGYGSIVRFSKVV